MKCPPQGIYYVFCIKLREEEHNTHLNCRHVLENFSDEPYGQLYLALKITG